MISEANLRAMGREALMLSNVLAKLGSVMPKESSYNHHGIV